MKRRTFNTTLGALPAALALPAAAQSGQMFRVAWVSTESKASPSPNLAAFRSGLRDLGYTEGRDLALDAWWGEGLPSRWSGWRPTSFARGPMWCWPQVAGRWAHSNGLA